MKTFNIRYRSIEKLKSFLETHQLHTQKNMLVQVFTSMVSASHVLTLSLNLKTLLPNAVIAGCSTDGEIIDGKVLSKNTVISITLFEKSFVDMLFIHEYDDSYTQGQQIAKRLIKKDTKALIIFATFNSLNAQDLLDGIYHDKNRDKSLVISGALASDYGKFKSSFLFNGEKIVKKGIIALSLSGQSLYASNAYLHDWEPISRKFIVNKVENNRVYTLDNKPIKELYSQYIGSDGVTSLPLYSLQFPFVVLRGKRFISKLAIEDPDDGSLLFTSNIKKGEILQISFANIDEVTQNSKRLFDIVSTTPTQTLFIYASSARRRFLEHFSHNEIESLKEISPMSGFFGFGEFFANSSQSNLFSQSLTVLSLSESDEIKAYDFAFKKHILQQDLDYKTVKVLSSIAQVSSVELEELNAALEERVRAGIEENRKKDSIMIHNSKLAQLGEMMGLIAHQWRQPLSAISATATGMQIKFELDSWTPEYVESSLHNIEEYVLHLSDTINDFTNFFKPSKRLGRIQAREIIKKALFIMSPLLTKENITILNKYNSENSIETYPNEVVQVVLNLIKNAVNALAKREIENPEIIITEYEKGGKNFIEVSDNAGGIDEKIFKKIFEPYFSTKNAENSMGLGLYMSKFIIEESCAGTLNVENIDNGVKFTIIL